MPAATELKPFVTARGVSYHPLWQLVPWLEPFYTSYEKQYNSVSVMCMYVLVDVCVCV
jgi:hypothetical protein